jgi:hypothetical protein
MEINKKSRTELKAFFVKNALPTTGNYGDLIDAALNQKDDGLAKAADQPLQIAASTAGDRPAIHLYESFATDVTPAWVISLQVGGKKGFGLGDGSGKNRLFIDGATGEIGVDGPLAVSSAMSGAPNDYAKAQYALSGGGTVTWGGNGGRLKWTSRLIALGSGTGGTFSKGHMDIGPSAANLAVVQDWDGAPRPSDATGVVLGAWETLYAVHTPGGDETAVTLRIVSQDQKFTAPSNWILVAFVNADNNTVKLGTGQILAANSTVSKGALVPSGTIVMWFGATTAIPDGWSLCDGSNSTPDLRDRFIVAAGTATYPVGAKGGESSHTLTAAEMPNHYHSALASGKDDLNFTGNHVGGNTSNERIPFMRSDANDSTEERTRTAGGGGAHENRPPYFALYFIMKL